MSYIYTCTVYLHVVLDVFCSCVTIMVISRSIAVYFTASSDGTALLEHGLEWKGIPTIPIPMTLLHECPVSHFLTKKVDSIPLFPFLVSNM